MRVRGGRASRRRPITFASMTPSESGGAEVPGRRRILPLDIQERIDTFAESSMGVHRVDLILSDGHVIEDVSVAWGEEVVARRGIEPPDFDESQVVDVRDRSDG